MRKNSKTYGNFEIINRKGDNYILVSIPPLVWYGFKGISQNPSLVASITDMPHDPAESEKLDFLNSNIPFDWKMEMILQPDDMEMKFR